MHTDTAPKEKPTGDGNPTAGYTVIQTVPNTPDADKLFHSLNAAYAMHGHALHLTDPNDGAVTYWAERWRPVHYLPAIDTAWQFLEQVRVRL